MSVPGVYAALKHLEASVETLREALTALDALPAEPEPTPAPKYLVLAAGEITKTHYHNAMGVLWKNVGGDWLDAEGTPQGSTPFKQHGGDGEISLDLTLMLADWSGLTLRASHDHWQTWSARGEQPPYLLIDGQPVAPSAVVQVSLSTVYNLADRIKIQASRDSSILLDFPIPERASSAVLVLQKLRGFGDVQVFRTDAPVA